jgi:hypothetical protein
VTNIGDPGNTTENVGQIRPSPGGAQRFQKHVWRCLFSCKTLLYLGCPSARGPAQVHNENNHSRGRRGTNVDGRNPAASEVRCVAPCSPLIRSAGLIETRPDGAD